MFNKEFYEDIKTKTREINKLKTQEERIDAMIAARASIYARINDEVDDLFSNINTKKGKDED
jgi:molybdopterin-guanine dinucleotide biosynthesis protein A